MDKKDIKGLAIVLTEIYLAMFLGIGTIGNLFVAMGNHRVFAYQALKAVREFVTGQEEKGISFDATLYPVTIREMDVEL